jgi:hypothetical protein
MPGTDVQPGFPLLRLIPATEDDRPSDIVEDAGRELRLSDRGRLRFLGRERHGFIGGHGERGLATFLTAGGFTIAQAA